MRNYLVYSSDVKKISKAFDIFYSMFKDNALKIMTNHRIETTIGINIYFTSDTINLCGLRFNEYICLDDDIDSDTEIDLLTSKLSN